MSSRWLKLLEEHIEKGVLGLAALYMLAMFGLYLVRSPNATTYQGRELGPRELMEAIKADADALERTFRAGAGEGPRVDDFSKGLLKEHGAGIFASASQEGLALSPELPLAATFGQPIVVPGLKESEEAAGSIALVTPLKPSQPKLRTGRSLVVRKQVEIPGLEQPAETPPPEEESAQPVEVAWVTAAAYFNKKAQYNEMIKAGYAPYRSKAYVVGVDVQRQEMLSNGEFSDWQDVKAPKAMPRLELPEPVFDDQTGELVNKDKIRQTFAIVKQAQPILVQPPFYPVVEGDFWELPALAGHEERQEKQEQAELDKPPVRVAEGNRRPAPPARGRTGGGRGRPRGGAGRSGGEAGGGGRQAVGTDRSDARRRADARKQIRLDLREARKLLGQKEYNQALNLASRIIGNADATAGHRAQAEKIVKHAQRWLERQRARAESGGVPGGAIRFSEGLGRPARSSERVAAGLITHPETAEPAIWFHDDTVQAGRTYRYRMRVNLWNRYVGRMRAVQNPEDAKRTVVAGEWSLESEPVTVTPSTYFFLSGSRPPYTAGVDVWRWREGFWIKQRFDVAVGEVIGGVRKVKTHEYDEEGDEIKADVDFTTGAVVLDLRFDQPVKDRWPGKDGVFTYRDKTSTIMVYLDPADGQVKQRALIFDRRDPKKKELEDQAW